MGPESQSTLFIFSDNRQYRRYLACVVQTVKLVNLRGHKSILLLHINLKSRTENILARDLTLRCQVKVQSSVVR